MQIAQIITDIIVENQRNQREIIFHADDADFSLAKSSV